MATNKLTKDQLRTVRNEVFPAAPAWYDLGLELGLLPDDLDSIKKAHNDEPKVCLREVLKTWLSGMVDPEPTWEKLIAALRCRSVGYQSLAYDVESKYCKSKSDRTVPTNPPPPSVSSHDHGMVSTTKMPLTLTPMQLRQILSPNNFQLLLPRYHYNQIPHGSSSQACATVNASGTGSSSLSTPSFIVSVDLAVMKHTSLKRPLSPSQSRGLTEAKISRLNNIVEYNGVKYNFINPVDKYLICGNCDEVVYNPHRMYCCHALFCKQCCSNTKCLSCKRKGVHSFPDGRSSSLIQKLRVRCLNNSSGCLWVGELQSVNEHISVCLKHKVPCSYRGIGCKKKLPREQLSLHMKENQLKHLSLTVKSLTKKMSDLEEHKTSAEKKITDLQHKIIEQEMELKKLREAIFCSPPVTLNVSVKELEVSAPIQCLNPVFYTHIRGYKVAVAMRVDPMAICRQLGTYENVFIALVPLSQLDDDQRQWPCEGTVKLTISFLNHTLSRSPYLMPFSLKKPESGTGNIPKWSQLQLPNIICIPGLSNLLQHPYFQKGNKVIVLKVKIEQVIINNPHVNN